MKAYKADVTFRQEYPDTIALHCSDGRFTGAVHALLSAHKHSYYDIMALPGGPALLDMSTASIIEAEATRGGTSFLVQGHHIEHAFLIAHENCGFYKKRYAGQPADRIRERQVRDLRMAHAWFGKVHPTVDVALFMASPNVEQGSVVFSPVEPGAAGDFTFL